ncbi:MAG: hypothetical protein KJ915_10405 [Candidatus Omnitrophica bacterium]|nr:hypothetical protein [Candidatus Omnitrophota bacterium]
MIKNKKTLIFFVILLLSFIFADGALSWTLTDMDASPIYVPADGVSSSTITASVLNAEDGGGCGSMYLVSYVCGKFTETNCSNIHFYYWDVWFGTYQWWRGSEAVGHLVSDTPNWAWVYTLINWYECQYQDLEIVTFYNIELTTSTSSSRYAVIDKNLSLETKMNPYTYPASYTWSMVSGPGDVTFSSPSSSSTDFSADTLGTYQIQCECLVDGADDSYILELEIKVVNVEFFKTGTQDPITEAHVGTDGDVNTTQGGEEKEIDIKITPSDLELDFSLSNTDAEINTSSGSGTTTVKITGKGDGLEDSELYVKDGDIEVTSLPIQIHKPDRVVKINTVVAQESVAGQVGQVLGYRYGVWDTQNRQIVKLDKYKLYERLDLILNDNGFGPDWIDLLDMRRNPFPGEDIADPNDYCIMDRVGIIIPNNVAWGWDPQQFYLSPSAEFQFHNSVYIMGIYLKGSTYRHTITPLCGTEYVTNIEILREELGDDMQVTIENDDID